VQSFIKLLPGLHSEKCVFPHFLKSIFSYIAEYTDRKKLFAIAVIQRSLRANLIQDVFTLRSVSADGIACVTSFFTTGENISRYAFQ
jgi:hypothetical protein